MPLDVAVSIIALPGRLHVVGKARCYPVRSGLWRSARGSRECGGLHAVIEFGVMPGEDYAAFLVNSHVGQVH
jgi:hypothetical protein